MDPIPRNQESEKAMAAGQNVATDQTGPDQTDSRSEWGRHIYIASGGCRMYRGAAWNAYMQQKKCKREKSKQVQFS